MGWWCAKSFSCKTQLSLICWLFGLVELWFWQFHYSFLFITTEQVLHVLISGTNYHFLRNISKWLNISHWLVFFWRRKNKSFIFFEASLQNESLSSIDVSLVLNLHMTRGSIYWKKAGTVTMIKWNSNHPERWELKLTVCHMFNISSNILSLSKRSYWLSVNPNPCLPKFANADIRSVNQQQLQSQDMSLLWYYRCLICDTAQYKYHSELPAVGTDRY